MCIRAKYVSKVDDAVYWAVWISCVHFLFRSLGPENLLLKGATLKNTKKIYGEQILRYAYRKYAL